MACVEKGVVVYPNTIFRDGLIRILSDVGGIECLGVTSIEEIDAAVLERWPSDLFIVDLGQDCSVVAAGIQSLKKLLPAARVVVFSERYSRDHMLTAIRAGACGYILHQSSCAVLIKALELICLGEFVVPAQALRSLCSDSTLVLSSQQSANHTTSLLSERETEVLQCLSQGKSNKIIARHYGISEATVKVHVKAILRKMHVKNRTEAALLAWSNGANGNGHGKSIDNEP